jgi:hypothetical protein
MNALIAMAKRPSVVLSAAGQENGSWGFSPASARNAPERESVFALSAAGQALTRLARKIDGAAPLSRARPFPAARAAARH